MAASSPVMSSAGGVPDPSGWCSARLGVTWDAVQMSLADLLERDRNLAAEWGVVFTVVGRPTGLGPSSGPPESFGTFGYPGEAVSLARSLAEHDVTVVADGHGAYWSSREPDTVDSKLLALVCRDKRLGPDEAQREQIREELRDEQERLGAEQRFIEAVDLIRSCEDTEEARQRLEACDPPFSYLQAMHLLITLRLRRLTHHGQDELQAELARSRSALDALGPSLLPPDA